MNRRFIAICAASVLVIGAIGAGAWRLSRDQSAIEDDSSLPIPPFPPRIAQGSDYESCLATLEADPVSAAALAESWEASGGGDGAVHCRGLALIATGNPAAGAEVLEQLARQSDAPALARASILGQAAQARLMVRQPDLATDDATAALALAPHDIELLILRAAGFAQAQNHAAAIDDLTAALNIDATRTDALLSRAVMHRKRGELALAEADVARALQQDPDDQDALLERGILRERMGDRSGARDDWERARGLDPNSTTADLASQNLALLEAGQAHQ